VIRAPIVRSRAFVSVTFLLAAGLAALWACDAAPAPAAKGAGAAEVLETSVGRFTRADVLASIAACTASLTEDAARASRAFEAACVAGEKEPSDTKLAETKSAYVSLMHEVQRAELVRFGPYGPKTSPGGEDVRAHVYAWPALNPCLVDETIVAKGYEAGDFFARSLVGARGTGAAESLLFRTSPETACAPTSALVAEGTWASLTEAERADRRRAYLVVVAKDVRVRLERVAHMWAPGGGFSNELASAGKGSRHFGSPVLAINAIVDALFYLESDLKDQKLGRPLGKTCSGATCKTQVESVYAKLDVPYVRANLDAFSAIFFGCGEGGAGLALDDLLEGLGAKSVAADMRAAASTARAAAEAITVPSMEDAVAREPERVAALHEAVRRMTDVLKVEVLSAFDLELPKRVEGDND